MEEKILKIMNELEYGVAYIITFLDEEGQDRCYDLWLDREDMMYYLQTIFMLDGKADEVGETIGYSKSEITKKLLELSSYNNFYVREME